MASATLVKLARRLAEMPWSPRISRRRDGGAGTVVEYPIGGMRSVATLFTILTVAVACAAPSETVQRDRALKAGDTVKVSATAYCLEGETKAGTETRRGIVAADPRVLPLGTVIRVDGLKGRHNRQYVVEDTGRAIKGRDIDIYMPSCEAATDFGRQDARARVIRVGKPTR